MIFPKRSEDFTLSLEDLFWHMGVREGGGSISKQHEKGANELKKRSLKQGFIPSGGYWFEDSKVRFTPNGCGKNLNAVVAGMLTSMIDKNLFTQD